jgi:hypothetical protein
MKQKLLLSIIVCAALAIGAQARAACIDVRQTQPLAFKGTLSQPVFPGPPNYEDVKKGDKPERAYIIKLDAPICATGDDFLDSSNAFNTVQLLVDSSTNDSAKLSSSLTRMLGKRVQVTGKSGFGAQTGHHHAPLLMTLINIAADRGDGAGR